MKVGIDAHKRNCTVAMFEGDSVTGSFDFPTTRQGVSEFMEKVPHGSTVVIEASTTGRVLSKMLLQKYDVHMVAPPERKISVKTDRRDSERIVREDSLGYLRRCYIPTPYIEELRSLVSRQVQTGHDISRVKSRIHSLLESNMVQHEFDGLSDIFGARGLKKMTQLQLPRQDMITLARYLEELKMHVSHHRQQETELARVAASDKERRQAACEHTGSERLYCRGYECKDWRHISLSHKEAPLIVRGRRAAGKQQRRLCIAAQPRQARRCDSEIRPDMRRKRRDKGCKRHFGQALLPEDDKEGLAGTKGTGCCSKKDVMDCVEGAQFRPAVRRRGRIPNTKEDEGRIIQGVKASPRRRHADKGPGAGHGFDKGHRRAGDVS